MSAGPGGIYPVAPDSRHFAVRGGLCWLSNPALEPPTRERLVSALKVARRVVLTTRQGNRAQEAAADEEVEQAKTALGERGQFGGTMARPTSTRHLARTGPYADWYAHL